MTVSKFQLPVSGFTSGLNTEASALNVLPTEMLDGTINVELESNGSAKRRKGIDFIGESDIAAGGFLQLVRSSTYAAETAAEAVSAVRVRLTAPNGNIVDRVVVDIDNEFWIFKVTNAGLKNIDAPFQTLTRSFTHADQKFFHMSFAASGDRLYFAGHKTQPGYLEVDADNESLVVTYFDVLIRDSAATAQNSAVSVGTAWYECIEAHTSNTADNKPGSGTNQSRYWFQKDGGVPAGISAWADATAYTTSIIKRYNKLTTPTTSSTYPTSVAFFAGRVWLIGDARFPNTVYFSQVVIGDRDIEKYLQEADPFFTTDPDLVADDGGTIQIQGMALAKQALAVGSSLFIGSNTGIWQISGPDGNFKATDFTNHQVLQDGVDGEENMVKVEDEFIAFGRDAIWLSKIETSAVSTSVGRAAFKSISEERVASYYSTIPLLSKQSAKAIYNGSENRVYYFHTRTRTNFEKSFNPNNESVYFTHTLCVDTQFKKDILETELEDPSTVKRRVNGSFFLYEFDDGALDEQPFIVCPFISKDVPPNDELVVVDTDTVQVDAVDVITTAGEEATDVVLNVVMQRVTVGNNVTLNAAFATFNTNSLRDWNSDTDFDIFYPSTIITGLQTHGNILVNKSVLYAMFVFKRVESGVLDADGKDTTPGGCYLSTAWNWSDNFLHPKFSDGEQIYFPDRFTYSLTDGGDEETHVFRKHRIRGRGHTLSLVFNSFDAVVNDDDGVVQVDGINVVSDTNKDFHLIGWMQQFYGGRT